MAHIRIRDLGITFHIYGVKSRSIRSRILPFRVGGGIVRTGKHNDAVAVEALNGITLDLKDGDRLGIVGRNGSGKTTLLRAMAGIYEPVSGSIDVEGRVASLTDMTLGMDPEASGYENIIMKSICMGATKSQAEALVESIEEFTELGEYLSLPVRTYSSGMAVRLAFAISTNVKPEILIMDEMIGAGDSHFAERARQRVRELIDNVGILVIASHSSEIIRQFCNKALFLRQGRIEGFGEVGPVLTSYEQLAV